MDDPQKLIFQPAHQFSHLPHYTGPTEHRVSVDVCLNLFDHMKPQVVKVTKQITRLSPFSHVITINSRSFSIYEQNLLANHSY